VIPIRDTIVSRHPPVAMWVLIGLNTLAFAVELLLPQQELERLFYLCGLVPARYTHPAWAEQLGFPIDDYWPFLTSMFLHGGVLHVVANLWTLWIFGDNVEDKMGPVRFTVFYLVCGVVAGAVHMMANPDSTVPAIGASGAIAGVMGAYFVMFPYAQVIVLVPVFFLPLFFQVTAFFYLALWFLMQLLSGTAAVGGEATGIAFFAHIGGFVAGILLFPLFLRPRRERRPPAGDEGWIERAWSPHRHR